MIVKTLLGILTASGERNQSKQIRQSVLEAANSFLANVKRAPHWFTLHFDVCGQSYPQGIKRLFNDDGGVKIWKKADEM